MSYRQQRKFEEIQVFIPSNPFWCMYTFGASRFSENKNMFDISWEGKEIQEERGS